MATLEYLYNQFEREYKKFEEYDYDDYILEVHIVFLDGKVVHTNMYGFMINRDRIFFAGEMLSPADIDHITYLIEKRIVEGDEV